jgi:hypothetical protein
VNPYAPPGSSPYAAPPAPPAGSRPGIVHVRINMVIQAVVFLVGAFYVLGIVVTIAEGTYATLGARPPSGDPAEQVGEAIGHFIAAVLLPIWSGLTLVWAPLNVWGLWKLKPWGRISTLVYSALSLFTCCCLPFGIYTLVSLHLPRPHALFARE